MDPTDKEARRGKAYLALLILVYLAAILLRAWRVYCGVYIEENAQVGIMGMDLLRGHYSIFHVGRAYHGNIDALLQAPFYALFGPTHLVQNIWTVVLSFLPIPLLHPVFKRIFPPAGVLLALAFMAGPAAPAMLWAAYGQLHIITMIPLLAWHLLLAARLWESGQWKGSTLFWWGFAGGFAFYVNFQAVMVVFPCIAFLALSRWRMLGLRPVFWAGLGGVIGAAPVIYFNAVNGWIHLQQPSQLTLEYFWPFVEALFFNALPLSLGFTGPLCGGVVAPGAVWFWPYVLVAGLLLLGALRLAQRGVFGPARLALLPLVFAVPNLSVVLVTHFGKGLSSCSIYYLLAFYFLAMPFFWGSLGEMAARLKKPALAALLVLVMAAVHVWGWATWTHMWNIPLFCSKQRAWTNEAQAKTVVRQLRQAGVKFLYKKEPFRFSFYGWGNPEVASPWEDWVPGHSVTVDASLDPYWWLDIGGSLQFLGLPFKTLRLPGLALPHQVGFAAGAQSLAPRHGWAARTLDGRELGGALNDGDWTTGFITPRHTQNGDGFLLDLGREQSLGGLSMVAGSYREIPHGLKIEAAGQDQVFRTLRQTSNYWGPFYVSGPHPFLKLRYPRVECYFPPTTARYLRVSHIGKGPATWSVRELLPFGPGRGDTPPDWALARQALMAALEKTKPKRIYGDAWPSALARQHFGHKVFTVIGNQTQTVWGDREPDILAPVSLEVRPGSALVVTEREASATANDLTRAGVRFTALPAGQYRVFSLAGRPLGRALAPAAVTANRDQANAAALAKGGKPGGRWGSGAPQKPGMWLSMDMGQPAKVGWLRLSSPNHPLDYPRGLAAQCSDDGRAWRDIQINQAAPLVFSGQIVMTLPGPVNLYRLRMPAPARFIRVGPAAGHPVYWWSVEKLALFAGE